MSRMAIRSCTNSLLCSHIALIHACPFSVGRLRHNSEVLLMAQMIEGAALRAFEALAVSQTIRAGSDGQGVSFLAVSSEF